MWFGDCLPILVTWNTSQEIINWVTRVIGFKLKSTPDSYYDQKVFNTSTSSFSRTPPACLCIPIPTSSPACLCIPIPMSLTLILPFEGQGIKHFTTVPVAAALGVAVLMAKVLTAGQCNFPSCLGYPSCTQKGQVSSVPNLV